MVETPRKRKVTDFSIDRIVDKKRRTKQPPVAVPMASTEASTVPENRLNEEEEDDEGLPPITFLPRSIRNQIQRNASSTTSSHQGVTTADQSVMQPSRPLVEQRNPPVYVVEEESNC